MAISRDAPAVPGHDRPRVPHLRRPHQGVAAGERRPASKSHGGTRVADMKDATARSCRRLPPARGSCPGAAPQSGRPRARRATAGLDPKQIIETRQLIQELARSHDYPEHAILPRSADCQRVVIINKGRVVAVDTPANLHAQLSGAETMYVLVDGGDATGLLQGVDGCRGRGRPARFGRGLRGGERARGDIRRDLARAVVTKGWVLELRRCG